MTILDQLTGCARERTVQAKLRISLEELKQQDGTPVTVSPYLQGMISARHANSQSMFASR